MFYIHSFILINSYQLNKKRPNEATSQASLNLLVRCFYGKRCYRGLVAPFIINIPENPRSPRLPSFRCSQRFKLTLGVYQFSPLCQYKAIRRADGKHVASAFRAGFSQRIRRTLQSSLRDHTAFSVRLHIASPWTSSLLLLRIPMHVAATHCPSGYRRSSRAVPTQPNVTNFLR